MNAKCFTLFLITEVSSFPGTKEGGSIIIKREKNTEEIQLSVKL